MVMDSDDREDFAFQKFPDEALVTLALKYLRGTWTQVAQGPPGPLLFKINSGQELQDECDLILPAECVTAVALFAVSAKHSLVGSTWVPRLHRWHSLFDTRLELFVLLPTRLGPADLSP